MTLTLLAAAEFVASRPVAPAAMGNPNPAAITLAHQAALASAGPHDLAYWDGSEAFAALAAGTRAGAVLVPRGARPLAHAWTIPCDAPRDASGMLDAHLPPRRQATPAGPPEDHIDPSAILHRGAFVAAGAAIGPGCVIMPGAYIAACCRLAGNVTAGPGATLGEDGFGLYATPHGFRRFQCAGLVIIGAHVSIGAQANIARGRFDDTVIGPGTHLDAFVQVGHGVRIGRDCRIAAQTGIAGGAEIGDGCVIGGQCGVAGHVVIAAGTVLAARTGVIKSLPKAGAYAGFPARPHQEWLRRLARPR